MVGAEVRLIPSQELLTVGESAAAPFKPVILCQVPGGRRHRQEDELEGIGAGE